MEDAKLLLKNLSSSLEKEETEKISDILQNLLEMEISPALLKSLKVPSLLEQLKKKYSDNSVILDSSDKLLRKYSSLLSSENRSKYSEPSDSHRKKCYLLFKDHISKSCDAPKAKYFALMLEYAVNELKSVDDNLRDYLDKCRSLLYNLVRNADLLTAYVEEHISAHDLVRLHPSELANKTMKELRRQEAEKDSEARQSNWYEIHRSEIKSNIGLDPSLAELDEECNSDPEGVDVED